MAQKATPLRRPLKSIMAELRQLGTAQNRKVYGRHGVNGDMFGVSFAHQNRLAKAIKQDHTLATELWATKNFDARVLATMIIDPELVTSALLEDWVQALESHALTDVFIKVPAQSALAHKKAEAWCKKTTQEWTCRAGWMLVASIAIRSDPTDATWLKGLIPVIRDEIHTRKNRIKDAMNYALIAIGGGHDSLTSAALSAADKIGKVEVDHGETGCKTRPAREYIASMVARKQAKAAKKNTGAEANKGAKKAAPAPRARKLASGKAGANKPAKKTPR